MCVGQRVRWAQTKSEAFVRADQERDIEELGEIEFVMKYTAPNMGDAAMHALFRSVFGSSNLATVTNRGSSVFTVFVFPPAARLRRPAQRILMLKGHEQTCACHKGSAV